MDIAAQPAATAPTTADDAVAVPRATWEALTDRLAALEAQVFETAAAPAPLPGPVTVAAPPQAPAPLGRRRALATLVGAAAAVGTGALVATAQPAAAANNSNLLIGNASNTATARTLLTVTGSNVVYGFGVYDNSYGGGIPPCATFAHAAGTAFSTAAVVRGTNNATGIAVDTEQGTAGDFYSDSPLWSGNFFNRAEGHALRLHADSGRQLLIEPSTTTPLDPNKSGQAGEVRVTTDNVLWFCTASGKPGTWRRLAGPASSGALHVLPSPVRVYDSRVGTQPNVGVKSPLVANANRTLDLKANASGVPGGATAALVNVLLVNAKPGAGNFTVWANGVAKPLANTLVWGGDAGRFSTAATVALDPAALCQVSASATTDLVLDVVGYYR